MPLQRADVPLQERLLGLRHERHHERRPGEARPHLKQVHLDQLTAQQDLRLPPIDLALNACVADQRHEHLADIAQLPALAVHIPADLPLGHSGAVLLHQPLPDPTSCVTLLTRRLPIRLQPAIDHRPIRPQLRRRPRLRRTLRRRDRRLQRLPDRPPMHPVTLRQLPDRQPLARVIAPDLLELLHSAHYSFRTFQSRLTKREPKSSGRTEVGPVQASTVGPVQTSTPSYSELENGFASTSDPERLRAICDSFAPEHVQAFFDRWIAQLPTPLTGEDRAGGYRWLLSMRRVEVSRTLVFDAPRHGA